MGFKEDPTHQDEETRQVRWDSSPPDGGWGWIVVLGSFLCNVIVDGVCLSFGVAASELSYEFKAPLSTVTLIGSLLAGSYLTVGPVVSALAARYGCRRVTIVGSIVAASAFILSTQSTSIEMLIITYGLFGGIGFGMIYLPSIVTVGYWFETKRAFATGLVVCGSGIGTFVFAPFARYLLDEYGWRGTNLIMAGMILNCAVCGALFRPLEKKTCKRTKRGVVQRGSIMKALIEEKKRQRTISNGSLDNCIITKDNRLIKLDPAIFEAKSRNNSLVARLRESLGFSSKSLNKSNKSLVMPNIVLHNGSPQLAKPVVKASIQPSVQPRDQRIKTNVSPGSDSGCSTSFDTLKAKSCDVLPQNDPWLKLSVENSLNTKSLSCHNVLENGVKTSGLDASFISIQVLPNAAVSTLSRSSLQRVNSHYIQSRRSLSYGSRVTNPATIVSGSVMSIPQYSASIQSLDSETDMKFTRYKVYQVLKEMFDFHLLKSPMFLLLLISSVMTMLGYFVPYFYLTKKAAEVGVNEEQQALLVAIIGITNTVGRVISGWIADRPWADSLYLNNGALILAGVATLSVPFCNDFSLLAIYASLFGLSMAFFVSLRSILLVDLLGLGMLTKSFGILILFQGVASMVGSPLAGKLEDATASVDGTFYLTGALILASALMSVPLRYIKNWEKSKVPEPLPEEMPMKFNETYKIEEVVSAI